MKTIAELKGERAQLIAQARALHEAAEALDRDMTAEEQEQYDRLMAKAEELRARYERMERMAELEEDLEEPEPRRAHAMEQVSRAVTPAVEFMSRGLQALSATERATPAWREAMQRATPEYRQAFGEYLRDGIASRAVLQADSDAGGGYLVTPMQFVDRLIQAVDNAVYIRQWATVFSVPNAASLGVPTLESDPADADWTAELGTGTEDTNMSFGRRALTPHPVAKRIKVSNKLLRQVPDSESLVRSRLAYKFGITWEKAALTGSGSNQPLGVFTASDLGISTGRDVSEDNTDSAVTFDGLINARFALNDAYKLQARWLAHGDFYKQVAKIKDGEGQYIWRQSVMAGEPDMLLGFPAYASEHAPNTFTTGQYVAILGDFSHYWIADALSMSVQRLVELYAETNQVGLIGRLESDGMPVLEEAFVRVKLG
jgi:HK97 family phage major capsid protein